MNIKELLKLGEKKIAECINDEYATPSLDAMVMLMDVLNKDKIYILIHDDAEVSSENEEKYMKCINERIAGKPVQYIINKQEFMGLDFYVDERVLIPRADTEILVEKTLDICRARYKSDRIKILEIGTGSGAISISLAKLLPNANILSVDISIDAINVAEKNRENLVADNLSFCELDILGNADELKKYAPFDVIVSNPPYIESKVIDTLQVEVKDNEPMLALDGGEDGLIFYRRIAEIGESILKEDGFIVLEIGFNQAEAIDNIFRTVGDDYYSLQVIKDLSGLDRTIVITRN